MSTAKSAQLKCILDESQGKHVFTITGIISSTQNWDYSFQPSWKAALEAAKLYDSVDQQGAPVLHPFHMTDFESRRKPFDRWTNEQRIQLQSRLIDVLNGARLFYVSAQLPLSVFQEVCEDEGIRGNYKLKYLPCFIQLYTTLYKMVGERIGNTLGPVTLIADRNHDVSGILLDVDRHFRNLFPETASVLGGLSFESSKECIPLQGADLVTYEFMKAADCEVTGQTCTRISYQRLEKNAEILRFTKPSYRGTLRAITEGGSMKELKQEIRLQRGRNENRKR